MNESRTFFIPARDQKDYQKATTTQVKAIKSLLDDDRLSKDEKNRINVLLEGDITKDAASDTLSYFFGKSENKNGSWVKVEQGVLFDRKPTSDPSS